MFRSRKTPARPADDSDARIRMIDLETAQRRDPYAVRPRRPPARAPAAPARRAAPPLRSAAPGGGLVLRPTPR